MRTGRQNLKPSPVGVNGFPREQWNCRLYRPSGARGVLARFWLQLRLASVVPGKVKKDLLGWLNFIF